MEEQILTIIKSGIKYFNIGFMMFLFFTSMAILKKTPAQKLKSNIKRMVVFFIGIVFAGLYLFRKYQSGGMIDVAGHLIECGVSTFSTILLYDFAYKNLIKFVVRFKGN